MFRIRTPSLTSATYRARVPPTRAELARTGHSALARRVVLAHGLLGLRRLGDDGDPQTQRLGNFSYQEKLGPSLLSGEQSPDARSIPVDPPGELAFAIPISTRSSSSVRMT
jgi:hypothetical protein